MVQSVLVLECCSRLDDVDPNLMLVIMHSAMCLIQDCPDCSGWKMEDGRFFLTPNHGSIS